MTASLDRAVEALGAVLAAEALDGDAPAEFAMRRGLLAALPHMGVDREPAPATLNGVEGLVAEWRRDADEDEFNGINPSTQRACANQLEALVRAADNRDAAGVDGRALARYQPCGCVLCVCEDEARCHGCGAKHCGTRPHEAYVATPTAAPAGEAVALEFRRLRYQADRLESVHDMLGAAENIREAADKLERHYTHPPAAEVREVDALREALRDARRALAWAADHLPECLAAYERAEAALSPPGRAEGGG